MKQVADRAGVSTSTVSHVLNNTRIVSQEARERVQQAIADLRYIPSAVARSLKNDRTKTLGILIPNNSNPYFAEVIQGVEDASFEQGYNLILCNSYDDVEKQVAYIRVLLEKRIDGLILVASGHDEELIHLLAAEELPVVVVDREVPGVNADFIQADHEQGAYQAVRYLLELGHRRIACVAGPQDLLASSDRVAGYMRALQEAGAAFHSEWLINSDFTSEGGFRAFQQLLALPQRPSAIFVSNDLMAIGGLCAAAASGVQIPQQLSVVGYDDIALASFANPPLTTVAQPKHEIGYLTAQTLIERLKQPTHVATREKLPTRLVLRGSSCAWMGE
ncbi:LacI family DNA-binding transcriptional regulator [Massilia sp. W12]|uniref:LacI family DNA-binding transcriptional regulator n=1 Tax=Massilia sp. W12 TaxID=3126507 RepID=UPI0030CFBFE9